MEGLHTTNKPRPTWASVSGGPAQTQPASGSPTPNTRHAYSDDCLCPWCILESRFRAPKTRYAAKLGVPLSRDVEDIFDFEDEAPYFVPSHHSITIGRARFIEYKEYQLELFSGSDSLIRAALYRNGTWIGGSRCHRPYDAALFALKHAQKYVHGNLPSEQDIIGMLGAGASKGDGPSGVVIIGRDSKNPAFVKTFFDTLNGVDGDKAWSKHLETCPPVPVHSACHNSCCPWSTFHEHLRWSMMQNFHDCEARAPDAFPPWDLTTQGVEPNPGPDKCVNCGSVVVPPINNAASLVTAHPALPSAAGSQTFRVHLTRKVTASAAAVFSTSSLYVYAKRAGVAALQDGFPPGFPSNFPANSDYFLLLSDLVTQIGTFPAYAQDFSVSINVGSAGLPAWTLSAFDIVLSYYSTIDAAGGTVTWTAWTDLVGVEPNPGPNGLSPGRELVGGGSHKTQQLLKEAIAHDEDKYGDPEPQVYNANHDADDTPCMVMSAAGRDAWRQESRKKYRIYRKKVPRVSATGALVRSIGIFLEEELERAKWDGDVETPKTEKPDISPKPKAPTSEGDKKKNLAPLPAHELEKMQKDRAERILEKKRDRRDWHRREVENAIIGVNSAATAVDALETLIAHRARENEYQQLYMACFTKQLPEWCGITAQAMGNGWTFQATWDKLAQFAGQEEQDLQFLAFLDRIVSAVTPNEGAWIPDLTVFGCVEKNPGPNFPIDQKTAREGKKLADIEEPAAGEIVNARALWAETVYLPTGLNPNLTDVNTLAPFTVRSVDNTGTQVSRTFFPREILFVPDAVNIAGVVTQRAISSRWVIFGEVQVSGRPLIPSESAVEMVQAAIKGMKNMMRNDNVVIRGFKTNDVISVAQAKSIRGICLTSPFLKLILHYLGQCYADQLQNVPEVGQMSNYRNSNTTDPTVALAVDANISDAAAGVGEALGGVNSVFPFNLGPGTLAFHSGQDSVPAGSIAYFCPPGFINMFTNSGVGSSVGIAAFVLALATYPGFALHCRRGVLDAGINSQNIRAMPNSTTVYIPGQTVLNIILPRSGPVLAPRDVGTANAAVLLQPTYGSTITAANPGPNTAIQVSWVDNVNNIPLAQYLTSWATDINRGVIRKVISAFFALGDFDNDLWAAWELAVAVVARYPELVQTNTNMTPVAWARGAAATTLAELRHTLFTGFHTQSVGLPLTTAGLPPAEGFITGLDPLAWNKVATGTAFKDTEEYVVKELPFWLSDSIPLALAMVQTRLYAAAVQTTALRHRVPESTLTGQIFSNAQIMTFRDVAEDFICPGDGTNFTLRAAPGGDLVERALSLLHNNRVAREASGLHLFNRWSAPREAFGAVMDSAVGLARQGYSWGVLTDIWFNLVVNRAPFCMTNPVSPYLPEGSRPIREGFRNIKPANTAAKWGPLAARTDKYAYLDQGELLDLTDDEIWNQRLMYLDTVLAVTTEDIAEVVFTDRLPAGTLPGDRQRTAVEFGLTPSHSVCSIKLPFYDTVGGKALIPTTIAATANAVVSGINPPNVIALITMHVPSAAIYVGPKTDNYMTRLLRNLKGGQPSSADTKKGSSATDSAITTSVTN